MQLVADEQTEQPAEQAVQLVTYETYPLHWTQNDEVLWIKQLVIGVPETHDPLNTIIVEAGQPPVHVVVEAVQAATAPVDKTV